MRLRNLFLDIVMAGLTFGGTFTCNSDDDDDDDFRGGSSASWDAGVPLTGSVSLAGSSKAEQ